ncbi:septum formation family protein [Lolliginicoccus levis]|uniref:septum formation family protein n=1 Tax=Lolliginicoccus levis TaxID=2919542 RepID=UPI00241F0619|nr:septum formation family protein [Lolliginicoccus levis]
MTTHSSPRSTPPPDRDSRPRWRIAALIALLVLVAGSVATLIVMQATSDPEDEEQWETIAAPTTEAVAGDAFGSSAAGDCLSWSAPDAADLATVDCSEEHRFEVTAAIDLSTFPGSEFGPGAGFPTELRFSELRQQLCEPATEDYLGSRFDPRGRYSINLINPGEDGWLAGERTIRCGLQNVGASGQVFPMFGRAAEQNLSMVWEPGFCIGINLDIPTDPVPCEEPHAYEVAGIVDLGEQFGDSHPPVSEQDRFLDERCRQIAAEYLGGPERLEQQRLTVFWDTRALSSWLAGNRSVNCSLGAQLDAGSALATLVGPARGEITINGQRPDQIASPEPPAAPAAGLAPGN